VTANSITCSSSVPMPAAPPSLAPVAILTAALARGNEQAFRDFHAAYAGRLLRYALAVTNGDASLAEEAVQIAFVRIAKNVRTFTNTETLWAWLARVVRCSIIDCARRHSRYAALLVRLRQEPLPDPSPDEIERTFAENLQAVLATLPRGDRALLTAKYDDGQSTAQLAEAAGCTSKAVESRLARLRQRIRDLVIERIRHEN
jgi:RNA polymerase sigma-70 factor, ECF subfamily